MTPFIILVYIRGREDRAAPGNTSPISPTSTFEDEGAS
jgi:hypothetical protein